MFGRILFKAMNVHRCQNCITLPDTRRAKCEHVAAVSCVCRTRCSTAGTPPPPRKCSSRRRPTNHSRESRARAVIGGGRLVWPRVANRGNTVPNLLNITILGSDKCCPARPSPARARTSPALQHYTHCSAPERKLHRNEPGLIFVQLSTFCCCRGEFAANYELCRKMWAKADEIYCSLLGRYIYTDRFDFFTERLINEQMSRENLIFIDIRPLVVNRYGV